MLFAVMGRTKMNCERFIVIDVFQRLACGRFEAKESNK